MADDYSKEDQVARERSAAAKADADRQALEAKAYPAGARIRKLVDRRLGRGCGLTVMIAAVLVSIALFFVFLMDDDAKEDDCIQDYDACVTETPAPTPAPTEPTTAPGTTGSGMPDPADLPAGQELNSGTSGGQIGCIACDGKSRYINIAKSTTAVGDEERARQEIVWPDDVTIVEFGVQIPRPTKGNYGINLFVNGDYSLGCGIETGSSSCRSLAGQEPSRLAAGDRVTIIVGERGEIAEQGDFVLTWWFVVQPE
jgi:hypothetical protein